MATQVIGCLTVAWLGGAVPADLLIFVEDWQEGLRAWQSPTASPGFRLSQSSLRVRSATTVICGIIVALDSSER